MIGGQTTMQPLLPLVMLMAMVAMKLALQEKKAKMTEASTGYLMMLLKVLPF